MTTFILRRNTDRNPTIAKVAAFLEALGDRCDWGVTVGPYKRDRTGEQNRYLYGVAYAIFGDHFGWDKEDTADHFCGEYFGWIEKPCPKNPDHPNGVKRAPLRTTTTDEYGKRDVLDTEKFSKFIAFVQRFGAQHGVCIPDPGE